MLYSYISSSRSTLLRSASKCPSCIWRNHAYSARTQIPFKFNSTFAVLPVDDAAGSRPRSPRRRTADPTSSAKVDDGIDAAVGNSNVCSSAKDETLQNSDGLETLQPVKRVRRGTGVKLPGRSKGSLRGRMKDKEKLHRDGTPIEQYLTRVHTPSSADPIKKEDPSRYPTPKDRSRIDVINESLVDSILERLKPSLEKHVGCDIVDMNPGAAIFSKKLHDLLKPRTHILLEPDTNLYQKEVLQELLDAEGSTYKLIPETGLLWENIEKAFSKEYLPHQERFPKGDPRLSLPNDNLLFVANLGHSSRRSYGKLANITRLLLHQLLEGIRTQSIFHRYGMVRMLLWIGDKEKAYVLPRTISLRFPLAVDTEVSADVTEVAGTDGTQTLKKRHHRADVESSVRVVKRMKAAGIQPVKGRQSTFELEARASLHGSQANEDAVQVARPFIAELEDLEARFAAGEFPKFIKDVRSSSDRRAAPGVSDLPRVSERGPTYQTAEYIRMAKLRRRLTREAVRTKSADYLLDERLAIDQAKTGILALDSKSREEAQKALEEREQAWQYALEKKNHNDTRLFWAIYENHKGLNQDPPLLMWDCRQYEPIITRPEDFIPMSEMALLDVVPRTRWSVLQQEDALDSFNYIQNSMWRFPTQSVQKALSGIAHGAYAWLIEDCPSLTDPAQGGCKNLDQMSVRSLSRQHLQDITDSWMRWPFRPSRHDLLVKTGGVPAEITDNEDDDDGWLK